jgi:predicted ATPase/DNA-binding CsgD family transcriptional regulator
MGTATDTSTRRLQHLRRALERTDAPLDVFATLVDALLEGGDRAGALQTFRRYAARYENGDPRARSRLRSLHERVLWNAPSSARQTNIPTSRNVIVGREAETYAIAEQLRTAPVLCITGPGGVGKTRIALEVARRILPEYPDGVWWVDFSPVEDGGYCAEHVAHTLDLSLFQTTNSSLAEALSAKNCVLVLDRCERITDAVGALVSELRKRCPQLRLILTSRFRTGVPGECEVRIAPLDAPGELDCDRAAAARSSAVQLFVERAAAVDARFTMTDENAGAIAALCRKLGGLPLAIELAAASAAHLPLARIVEHMNAGQTDLRETIAWSYELLDEAGRATLRKLSIFVAPFTFEEAAAANGSDVSISLKRLIDASLVQTRVERGTPEYYLLDSMRDFARSLQSTGETTDPYRSLLAYYAKLPHGDKAALEKLDLMFANIANVLTSLTGDTATLEERLVLLGAPGSRFGILGHVEEMTRLCEDTLQSLTPQMRRTYAYADAVRTLAWLSNRRGRFRESIELAKEAAEIAVALDDPALAVRSLSNAYIASIAIGEYEAARAFSDEALVLAQKTGDPATIANALRSAGGSRVAVADFQAALPLYEELLALDISRIPQTVLALALHDYAIARLYLGHAKVARTLVERSIQLSAEAGDSGTQADAHNVLGSIALVEGNVEDALRCYRAALTLANRPGMHPITTTRTLEGFAASALRDDQLDAAAQILGHAEQMRRRIRSPLQPFEREKAHALRAAFASRIGDERFEAGLLAGRTKSFHEICELAAGLGAGTAPPEKAERFAALTAREREIAELAATGASNREISSHLYVSVRTVENHLATIYRKLGIKTRAEL